MTRRSAAFVAALALAGAACGDGLLRTADVANATFSINREAPALVSALLLHGDTAGPGARLDPAAVDSLFVTVVRVDVVPARGPGGRPDSLGPFGPFGRDTLMPPPDSARGPFGPGGPRGRHGHRGPGPHVGGPGAPGGMNWYELDVVSGGRIDLMHLPVEGEPGIVLASGSIPAGDYWHVRLVVESAEIWLNTEVTAGDGTVLPANTAIPVVVPSGALHAPVSFTVPEGAAEVNLVFRTSETLSAIVVTENGRVIVTPGMRHRR